MVFDMPTTVHHVVPAQNNNGQGWPDVQHLLQCGLLFVHEKFADSGDAVGATKTTFAPILGVHVTWRSFCHQIQIRIFGHIESGR
jgi:hypothetical protein